jgi:hypothetical protein
MLQKRQKVLAKAAPSTHDPKRTFRLIQNNSGWPKDLPVAGKSGQTCRSLSVALGLGCGQAREGHPMLVAQRRFLLAHSSSAS